MNASGMRASKAVGTAPAFWRAMKFVRAIVRSNAAMASVIPLMVRSSRAPRIATWNSAASTTTIVLPNCQVRVPAHAAVATLARRAAHSPSARQAEIVAHVIRYYPGAIFHLMPID